MNETTVKAPAPETLPLAALLKAGGTPVPLVTEAEPPPVTATAPPDRRARFAGLWKAGLVLLLGGLAGLAVETLLTTLAEPAGLTGWVIAAGLGLILLAALLAGLRSWQGLAEIDRLRATRRKAEQALADGTEETLVAALRRHFRGRVDLDWAWRRFDEAAGDAPDPAGQLAALDRLVLAGLDARAEAAARTAIRRCAMVTAISPFALLDMAVSGWLNLKLMLAIARLYGGRPGAAGGWRLLIRAFTAVLASGALDLTDEALGDALGAGLAAKLSRRAGVGLMNGLLTARIASAAMDYCRPLPFAAGPPNPRKLLAGAMAVEKKRLNHA